MSLHIFEKFLGEAYTEETRGTFVDFLHNYFLKDNFTPVYDKDDILSDYIGWFSFIQQVNILWSVDDLEDLIVLEIIKKKGSSDSRVWLTKEIFKLISNKDLLNKPRFNVLAVVRWEAPSKHWRLSLITSEGKTRSNPKRFSFLLGHNEKIKTVNDYLIKSGSVKDFQNLVERFDVEVVRKEFFDKYVNLFLELYKNVELNKDIIRVDLVAFTKKLLWKIVFLYFLQKKKWLWADQDSLITQGDDQFMKTLFSDHVWERNYVKTPKVNFYNDYLEPLFFEALSEERNSEVYWDFWLKIPYLNGWLFQKEYDWKNTKVIIPDDLFRNKQETWILDIFDVYNFTIYEDDPYDREIAVDPEMLGKIFENMISISQKNIDKIMRLYNSKKNWINTKEIGKDINKELWAYYTPSEIVHYITRESLFYHILNQLQEARKSIKEDELKQIIRDLFEAKEQHLTREHLKSEVKQEGMSEYDRFESIAIKVNDILKTVKVLDPAIWSWAFPMGILIEIFWLRAYLRDVFHIDNNLSNYEIKKSIIENNVFGVDIDPGAIDIARLRFWLSMVVDAEKPEPLPNLEFKFVSANTLGVLWSENEKGNFDNIDFAEYKKQIHKYYNPKNREEKDKIKDKIEKILYKADNLVKSEWASKLLTFKPFGQWTKAEFFDSDLMFDEKEFDIIIWNPPYSVISNNPWLYQDDKIWVGIYKYIENTHFWEKKHSLNDDYVKFFRFAEYQVEKQNKGIVAMITNHWYIDNPNFRWMRWHLLKTYRQIYNIDLHGNSKKKEVCPDWSKDENVFDIKQGVAISIMIKNDMLNNKILHKDLWWIRKKKLSEINNIDFYKNGWNILNPSSQFFNFMQQDSAWSIEYYKRTKIDGIFNNKVAWVQTSRDWLAIDLSKDSLLKKIVLFFDKEKSDDDIINIFNITDTRDYSISEQRKKNTFDVNNIVDYYFRPFDVRKIYYDHSIVSWPRKDTLWHMLYPNLSLISWRSTTKRIDHFLITNLVSDVKSWEYSKWSHQFPLFLYSEDWLSRKANIKNSILQEYKSKYGLDKDSEELSYNIIQYIYAILYSPYYREKYKVFLKSDFPRIPFVETKETFLKLSDLWSKLIDLHLMKNIEVNSQYPIEWGNLVEKPIFKDNKIYINKTQYFNSVDQKVWEFMIWGYQVIDKWLKSRKGRNLSEEDILHVKKIIQVLTQTIDIMKEIDEVIIKDGSF
jgi:hypothetical protein